MNCKNTYRRRVIVEKYDINEEDFDAVEKYFCTLSLKNQKN